MGMYIESRLVMCEIFYCECSNSTCKCVNSGGVVSVKWVWYLLSGWGKYVHVCSYQTLVMYIEIASVPRFVLNA